jgi:hypothetical protein
MGSTLNAADEGIHCRERWQADGFSFPAYAPEPKPEEGVWLLVKHAIGNLAAANLNQPTTAVKRSTWSRTVSRHRPDRKLCL